MEQREKKGIGTVKKSIAFLLALILLTGLFTACSNEVLLLNEITGETEEKTTAPAPAEKKTEEVAVKETVNHGDDFEPEEPSEEELPPQVVEQPSEGGHVLDGKKVIFIGNSFTYYGNAVITNARSALKQSQRINNKGYFYQICSHEKNLKSCFDHKHLCCVCLFTKSVSDSLHPHRL